jgi:hypothetical protein
VIFYKFNIREGKERAKRDNNNTKDNNGQLLKHDKEKAEFLEVAYIFLYSLTSLIAYGGGSQLVY